MGVGDTWNAYVISCVVHAGAGIYFFYVWVWEAGTVLSGILLEAWDLWALVKKDLDMKVLASSFFFTPLLSLRLFLAGFCLPAANAPKVAFHTGRAKGAHEIGL